WFGGELDVRASATDGAGSGVTSARLLIDGHPAVDATDGASWTFHPNLALLVPGREGAVTLQVAAADAVGNVGTASQTVQVDTLAPTISAVQIDSTPDGRDAAGQDWFRGPTVAPGSDAIVVSASIADQNLISSGDSAPVAIAGGARVPG